MVKFKNVTVRIVGEDGNAFFILGKVRKAMREAGISEAAITEYTEAAKSGDYNNLLRVTMATVNVK